MKARAHKSKIAGKSMIEFLLVAPVLLSITGGTIEVANFMRLTQISTVVSQEVANRTYRECSSLTEVVNPQSSSYQVTSSNSMQINHPVTTNTVNTCLQRLQSQTLARLNSLNSNTTGNAVHLIVARHNPSEAGTLTEFESFSSSGANIIQGSTSTSVSKDSANGNQPDTRLKRRNDDQTEEKNGADRPPPPPPPTTNSDYKQVGFRPGQGIVMKGSRNDSATQIVVPQQHIIDRKTVVVGQVVAGYTPVIRFFNLALLYSGDFRATTTM